MSSTLFQLDWTSPTTDATGLSLTCSATPASDRSRPLKQVASSVGDDMTTLDALKLEISRLTKETGVHNSFTLAGRRQANLLAYEQAQSRCQSSVEYQ